MTETTFNLRGDRNQCQSCKKYFNSSFAFDKHRTGEFGKDRRCMTTEEMEAKRMAQRADGFWVSALMSEIDSEARSKHKSDDFKGSVSLYVSSTQNEVVA